MTLGDRVAVLRKGVLQQVGTPGRLYERPVNLFVAGFIGSPPMNFMPAASGRPAPAAVRRRRAAAERREAVGDRDLLIVGIRPEHFEDAALVDAEAGRGETFTAESTSPSGSATSSTPTSRTRRPRSSASSSTTGRELDREQLRTQLVVSLEPVAGPRGQRRRLWLDPAMHLFDPAHRREPDSLPRPARGRTRVIRQRPARAASPRTIADEVWPAGARHPPRDSCRQRTASGGRLRSHAGRRRSPP